MDPTNIASVVVAVIAAGAAVASQRAAANASVRNTTSTTRTDIEREAFDRAKGYYTDTIDRQHNEIQDLEADVVALKGQVADAQSEIRDLRAELDTAKRTLRRAFPDAT